jgi:pyruvate dehydrogenase E1 component
VLAGNVPNVRPYDPAFAYEVATIVRDGIERMYGRGEDVFYYITLYNENYQMPKKPDGVDEGIVRGIYRLREAPTVGGKGKSRAPRARLVGSGSILNQVIAAQDMLADRFGVAAEVYSAPSFPLLRRDALAVDRWNRLHPDEEPRVPYVTEVLGPDGGPIVAATDWVKALPDMVARWLPDSYVSLGTDGFGRSDTREALRSFFEIDPPQIAAATLAALARCGSIPASRAVEAIGELGVDPEKLDPLTV